MQAINKAKINLGHFQSKFHVGFIAAVMSDRVEH